MRSRTLDHDLRATAARSPAHEAVVGYDHRLTYDQLDRWASVVAQGLLRCGVTRGDRVAVVMRSSAKTAAVVYGALRAGAAVVPVSARAPSSRQLDLVARCGAVAVVADGDLAHGLVSSGPVRVLDAEELVLGQGDATVDGPALVPVLGVDLAAVVFTSGSTGEPRGATFLHSGMHFAADAVAQSLGVTGGDRLLSVLPLSHTYGLYQLLVSVKRGATLVLEDGVGLPGDLLARMVAERITVLPGVPSLWHVLLGSPRFTAQALPDLRLVTNAGALLPVARVAALLAALPGVEVCSMYGQTECARVCTLAPGLLAQHPGSVGLPLPGTEVLVVDAEGREVERDQVGELLVRGEHVMQGYWNDPEATAAALLPGRLPGDRVLRTGDLFRRDVDGRLAFVGRCDDMITTRGEKVAPRSVEEVLCTAPGVLEAAVIGVVDEALGEAVVAHVTARPGTSLEPRLIRRHCAVHLEDFQVPRRVVVHATLPTLDNGKLDRSALQALSR